MLADNDVIAVHVTFGDEDDKALMEKWKRHFPDVRLVILHSEYKEHHSSNLKIYRQNS